MGAILNLSKKFTSKGKTNVGNNTIGVGVESKADTELL